MALSIAVIPSHRCFASIIIRKAVLPRSEQLLLCHCVFAHIFIMAPDALPSLSSYLKYSMLASALALSLFILIIENLLSTRAEARALCAYRAPFPAVAGKIYMCPSYCVEMSVVESLCASTVDAGRNCPAMPGYAGDICRQRPRVALSMKAASYHYSCASASIGLSPSCGAGQWRLAQKQ